jgi:hypothetical protein
MWVMVTLCCSSVRVGDWYHCLVLGGEGSINDVLYAEPPSIETKTHCESLDGGVFPKKATDVPVRKALQCFVLRYKNSTHTLKDKT